MRRTTDKKKKKRVIPTPKKIGGNIQQLGPKAEQILSTLPRRRLSNFDLLRLAKLHKLRRFRGVFMVDEFPSNPWKTERAIFNLDTSDGRGSHWVCYKKRGEYVQFFDSSGEKPPTEFVRYMKGCRISANRRIFQKVGSSNCGQLCLLFLLDLI